MVALRQGTHLTTTACTVSANLALSGGGGAVSLTDTAQLNDTLSLWYNNSAYASGGAVDCEGSAVVHFARSTFRLNVAQQGGALQVFCAAAYMTRSLFDANSAWLFNGGGVAVPWSPPAITIVNVTYCQFTNNTAASDGGGIGWGS